MEPVYIIDALRTPVGKYGGSLAAVRPDDLFAWVIRGILDRHPSFPVEHIEDVICGAANQAGEDNRNVARMAALLAGLPLHTGGNTVNRLCASGLQSIMDATRAIACGDGEIYLAGGVESMSRAPYVQSKPEQAFSRSPQIFDTTIGWRFVNPKLKEMHPPYSMGETAENVAEKYQISREAQDAFALRSQEKYFQAAEAGKFSDEILPLTIPLPKGKSMAFSQDEHPRQTSLEKLASLKPAFRQGGTVTAGNSSGINDGAAVMILASGSAVKKYGFRPLARIRSMAIAGVDPAFMGMGPVPASRKALERAGIQEKDLDLIELNEAFAAQSIPCIKELQLPEEKVNVNGGSIAIGHPLGCSGTRIATTLIYEMKRRKARYGLATMCIGVGQGAAMVFEGVPSEG